MAEQKRDTSHAMNRLEVLQSAYCNELVARMEEREREFKAKMSAQLRAAGKRALDGLRAIDPVKAAAVEAQMNAVTQTGLAGLKAATENENDMQTETKTTTTDIPYWDQPGRLTINWEYVLKRMKELAWAADGLRARCTACQTDKNKATKHIDNWCISCNVTLWNCAEWRRDQDQGGESINKYFSEHPIPDPFAGMSDWMRKYYERCLEKLVKEKAADMREPVWKDVASMKKVKAILNNAPAPPTTPPAASPKTWEFSEGCEGNRTIAYLPV